jgi:cytochrome c553
VVPPGCVRCHGDAQSAPISRLVPKLDGLSARYSEFSLKSYRSGSRASGIMQMAAGPLDDEAIAAIARYYAGVPPRQVSAPTSSRPDELAHGRAIAETGVPAEGIPACLTCHGGSARAVYPRLAGQHAPYIAGQLELWRKGLRQHTVLGQIMAPIARRLTPQQARAVANYLETLSAPEEAR